MYHGDGLSLLGDVQGLGGEDLTARCWSHLESSSLTGLVLDVAVRWGLSSGCRPKPGLPQNDGLSLMGPCGWPLRVPKAVVPVHKVEASLFYDLGSKVKLHHFHHILLITCLPRFKDNGIRHHLLMGWGQGSHRAHRMGNIVARFGKFNPPSPHYLI